MKFIDSKIIELESVDSTNEYLTMLLLSSTLPEGSVVFAHQQNRGKGQSDNIWESEPGKNLTASVVLYPHFLKPEYQFFLTMVVSLAVCSALDELQLPDKAMIKWPNDIYLGHRKVAGILIKNDLMGNLISTTIAGLGLNINQLSFSENAPNAVSLKMVTGQDYQIPDLLTECHHSLAFWYAKLERGETSAIEKAYLSRLYLLNESAWFEIKGSKVKAVIKGLAKFGMLHLSGDLGGEYICDLKEIRFLQENELQNPAGC